MQLADSCRDAQAGLTSLQAELCQPTAAGLEHCEAELKQIARSLAVWISGPRRAGAEDRAALLRLQETIRQFKAQADLGLHLCSGWAQIYSNAGYTVQGQPDLTLSESKASYEA